MSSLSLTPKLRGTSLKEISVMIHTTFSHTGKLPGFCCCHFVFISEGGGRGCLFIGLFLFWCIFVDGGGVVVGGFFFFLGGAGGGGLPRNANK